RKRNRSRQRTRPPPEERVKTIIVTSQVTYVPGNYITLLEQVLHDAGEHVAGLVLLQNLDASLIKTTVGLFALGAPRLGRELAKNIFELPLRRREKLFSGRGLPVLITKSM